MSASVHNAKSSRLSILDLYKCALIINTICYLIYLITDTFVFQYAVCVSDSRGQYMPQFDANPKWQLPPKNRLCQWIKALYLFYFSPDIYQTK